MAANSSQMISGKSFEFSILLEFIEKLKDKTQIEVIKNSSYQVARSCFENIDSDTQSSHLLTASFAVNFLMDVEPRLSNDLGPHDLLQLELLSDDYGKRGDVRDVLVLRAMQKWEIGVSAKNNHHAVKHPRLSNRIDFGKKWLGMKNSKQYFEEIEPVFDNLNKIREESQGKALWRDLDDYHSYVYLPVLTAFKNELLRLYKKKPIDTAQNLVKYLVGIKDYYKVIKGNGIVEIEAYNLHGTLNKSFKGIDPKYKIPILHLPDEISDICFISDTTIQVLMNNGWSMSFRIHNASSYIEPSLKFDINLLESPKSMFKNSLEIF